MFIVDVCFAHVNMCSFFVSKDVIAQDSLLEKCPIPALAKGWQTNIYLLLYSFYSVFTGY